MRLWWPGHNNKIKHLAIGMMYIPEMVLQKKNSILQNNGVYL